MCRSAAVDERAGSAVGRLAVHAGADPSARHLLPARVSDVRAHHRRLPEDRSGLRRPPYGEVGDLVLW